MCEEEPARSYRHFDMKVDGLALAPGDFLDAVLQDGVVVGHGEGIRIADIDLLLPRPPFTLGILNCDARARQSEADRAHHLLLLGGLEDVVILDVLPGGLRLVVALGADGLEALVEEVEFEFGSKVSHVAALIEPLQLLLQHLPRGMREIMVVVILHVTEHQGRARKPRHAAQRGEIGLQHEIAVALLPARGLVARHGLHIDVVGEKVVAGMGFLMPAIHEELGMEALADEPPLHIRETDENRIDLAGFHSALSASKVRFPAIPAPAIHSPRIHRAVLHRGIMTAGTGLATVKSRQKIDLPTC